jgi:hypothetical protein
MMSHEISGGVEGRRKYILLALLLLGSIFNKELYSQNCLMEPKHIAMVIPENRFVWLEGEASQGTCKNIPIDGWIKYPSQEFDLWIYSDGPSGSGRFWTIMIGITSKGQEIPRRGFCLETSTVGWRTLQAFKELPLPWLGDRDGDGKPELIIWESFPLSKNASPAEYGLTAWIYQVDRNGKCKMDWDLSRKMAGEIAAAYPKSLEPPDSLPQDLRMKMRISYSQGQNIRNKVAAALEEFAAEKCKMPAQRLRP